MCWLPRQQYMMDPIGVPFDKSIIQRRKPLNGILQIHAYYADTGTIFRGRLYVSTHPSLSTGNGVNTNAIGRSSAASKIAATPRPLRKFYVKILDQG
jgi:hypothetical protein